MNISRTLPKKPLQSTQLAPQASLDKPPASTDSFSFSGADSTLGTMAGGGCIGLLTGAAGGIAAQTGGGWGLAIGSAVAGGIAFFPAAANSYTGPGEGVLATAVVGGATAILGGIGMATGSAATVAPLVGLGVGAALGYMARNEGRGYR